MNLANVNEGRICKYLRKHFSINYKRLLIQLKGITTLRLPTFRLQIDSISSTVTFLAESDETNTISIQPGLMQGILANKKWN